MAKKKTRNKINKDSSENKKIVEQKHTEVIVNPFKVSYNWLFFGLLTILTILIYIPAMKAGFYYDDNHTVLTQHLIRDVGFGELLGNIFSMGARSLLTLTYYINFKMSYIEPWSYHLLSIFIHILNIIFVFILTTKLVKSFKSGLLESSSLFLPYIVSAIFAIHPLMTEGVTYVSSRSDQIPTMMTFLSLIFFIRYLERNKFIDVILSIIWFYLGLLGKETGMMIFFMIIVLLILWIRENNKKVFSFQSWKYSIPFIVFFLFKILKSYGTLNVVGKATEVGELVNTTPLTHYIYSEFVGNLKYLKLLIFPVHQSVRHDLIIMDSISNPRILFSLGILLLITYLVWKFFRNNNLFLFGFFYYIIVLSPVASIVRLVEVIAEHRLYHPSFGFYLSISILILKLLELLMKKMKKYVISLVRRGGTEVSETNGMEKSFQISKLKIIIPILLFLFIFTSLSILTYQRNKVWLGEIPLWTDALANRDPDAKSTVIYNNVGLAYFRDGQHEKAKEYYLHGAVISGLTSYHNLANLGTLYRDLKQYERAIKFFDLAIRAKPDFAYAHFDQGVSFAQLATTEKDPERKYQLMMQAKKKFEDTLSFDEHYLGAHRNLALIEQTYGDRDIAIEYLKKGFELEPYEGKYMQDIALIYMSKDDLVNARKYLEKALEMIPANYTVHLNLGLISLDENKPEEAHIHLTNAAFINDSIDGMNYLLGETFRMRGDNNKAIEYYKLGLERGEKKYAENSMIRLRELGVL